MANAAGNGAARPIEGTREAIAGILRRRSRVPIEEFAAELGLAGATIRRHLDILRRDGHVSLEQERGGAGRPRYVFSLTEAGADLFPQHYVRLTRRLVDEIVGLHPGETDGRDGLGVADLLFEKMAERLAREYAPRVVGETLGERVRVATELLEGEGLDFEVATEDGELRLLGRGCPCRRFGAGEHVGCDHDRRLLSQLIGAEVVEIPADETPTGYSCGYRVRERAH